MSAAGSASRPKRSASRSIPASPAAELLEEDGRIVGIATGDMGIGRDGQPTEAFQRGMELRARYTLFAEGCRGSLSKTAHPAVPPARRRPSADLRDRHQGIVGGAGRQTTIPDWWSTRSAGRWTPAPMAGSFLYHSRRQPDLVRLRHRARLPQSVAVAVRRDAALQDASRGAASFRRRPADQLRRTRTERGRPAIDPAPGVPRRGADRRCRRVRERAEDQGHATPQ